MSTLEGDFPVAEASSGEEYTSRTIHWQKALACSTSTCVELAALGSRVLIRDSKHDDGAVLALSVSAWNRFLDGAKKREFDI